MRSRFAFIVLVGVIASACLAAAAPPNIVFIFSDDQRHDALGVVNPVVQTPNMDALARSGILFANAFVTTSICSPSRAATLTGRYGSCNGVTALAASIHADEETFASLLSGADYRTAVFGKWHLGNTAAALGFQQWSTFRGNGSWFNRTITSNIPTSPSNLGGQFIEAFVADRAIDYIADHATNHADKAFVMWVCNQVPHLDGNLEYRPSTNSLNAYAITNMPVPVNWSDDLSTKPVYLPGSDFYLKSDAKNYGGPGGYSDLNPGTNNAYAGQDNVQTHMREYYASITDWDSEMGRLLDRLDDPNGDGNPADSIRTNTWVIFMGDNGWFTGHHKFTSKVLAYEESMRVPIFVQPPVNPDGSPTVTPRTENKLVMNTDLTQLILDIAGVAIPANMHGRNLRTLIDDPGATWRDHVYYEALTSELTARPHEALRTERYKYIRTYNAAKTAVDFEEIYDLQTDPSEMTNLAADAGHASIHTQLVAAMAEEVENLAEPFVFQNGDFEATPYDTGWNDSDGVAARTNGIVAGSTHAAHVGGAGTGRFSRPLPGLSDFWLSFVVQPVTTAGTRSWNLVLHDGGNDGSTTAGATVNLRGGIDGGFQVYNGTDWVNVPGGSGAFTNGQPTCVIIVLRNMDRSGIPSYDLYWSNPGQTGLLHNARRLTQFQTAAAKTGVTGVNFARTSTENGTYILDNVELAIDAEMTTCIEDTFETGISGDWDATNSVTHQSVPGHGADGSGGYAAIGAGGGMGERFNGVLPDGASHWSVSFFFRWSATANRKFSFHASTSATPTGAATLNLKYDDADGWAAYDGNGWVSIGALSGSRPTDDQWHAITIEGWGWGTASAAYDITVIEDDGTVTGAEGLTLFHQSDPRTTTANSFYINAVWGGNPGYDIDNVVALAELPEPIPPGKRIRISGVYPHLAMTSSNNEVGPGAVVPWADRLWVLTYGPHLPNGSDDKLYEIDTNLVRVTRPESVGGTPANRMIHDESDQLIIGPHLVDTNRNVTTIPYSTMPGRHTANARHLDDPTNKVYFFTMEDGLYEVDVNTRAVTEIYPDVQGQGDDHLHGYHGKGAYSGQGLLVVANNGRNWNTGDPTGESGVLATWDGSRPHAWTELFRVQHCEVTGPGGLHGNANPSTDPVWATGFDAKSVVLRSIEGGAPHTWRLPKGSYTHDGSHGWYTEWPRIRKLDDGNPGTADPWLMHMHGLFFDFPETFSSANASGLSPICAFCKMPVDYCIFNGQLVMGKNDTSKFSNAFVPRAQSNLWFGEPSHLTNWGAPHGHGGVWLNEDVAADTKSEPFLVNGFSRVTLHLTHTNASAVDVDVETSTGDGNWAAQSTVAVPVTGYAYALLNDLPAEWVRLKPKTPVMGLTAYFLLANPYPHPTSATNDYTDLAGIARTNNYSDGLVRVMSGLDLALEYASRETGTNGAAGSPAYHQIDGTMELGKMTNTTAEAALRSAIATSRDFGTDGASAWIMSGSDRLRLPRLDLLYDAPFASGWARGFRETVTERSMLNCHGTFYEIPRDNSGGKRRLRPLATHGKRITDFASWRGLFVLTGVRNDAPATNHVYRTDDGNAALWLGEVDDVWRMGEPRGVGGPWKNTTVAARTPSDAYLMYGYDRKELKLSHRSNSPVIFSVEVDFLGNNTWGTYDTFTVPAGETVTHVFPTGYQAHWVRVSADAATTATAQLIYGSAKEIEEPESESLVYAEYDFNGGSVVSIDTHGLSTAGDYTPVVGSISSVTYSHYVTPTPTPMQVGTFTVTADEGVLNLARLVVPLLATDSGADTPTYDFSIRSSVDGSISNLWSESVQVPAGDSQVATTEAELDLSNDPEFQGLDTITFGIYFSSPDSTFGAGQRVITSLSGTGTTAVNGVRGPFTDSNIRLEGQRPTAPGTVLLVR